MLTERGFDGPYVKLMQKVVGQTGKAQGQSLSVNATGAIGFVNQISEDAKNPMAYEIKQRAEEDATAHLRK